MGLVYLQAKGLIANYREETVRWKAALIEPGKAEASVKCAELTSAEVERIILKLDQLALSRQNEAIAVMLAEEMESILLAARLVKTESKAEFAGILGVGSQLDVMWLRPKDVGGSLLNPAEGTSLGLYDGTSGAVLTWLHTFTADTAASIIPEQIMDEEATVIHLGLIDPIEVPKCGAVKVTLAGIAAPAQSLPFNLRKSFGTEDMPVVRFEKPIIVGPERKQKIELEPDISGDSKPQLLSLLFGQAQDLVI